MSRNTSRIGLEIRRASTPAAMYIALVALAVGVAMLLAQNLTFQRPWDSYETVRVAFSNAKGIVPSKDPVRISGVNVGVVSAAALQDGQAVLTLQIQRQFGAIYRNAEVRIRPVTPLDDEYVDITNRGTPSAGVAGPNSVIPQTQTISPVDISTVLDAFDTPVRQRLTILLSELGTGLQDNGAQLREAFVQMAPFLHVAQAATTQIALRRQEVRELIHNFGSLTLALDKRNAELTTMVRSGDAALGALARESAPFNQTLADLPATVSAMRSSFATVSSLEGNLDPALVALEPVAADLRTGLTGLARFGGAAAPALRALQPAITALEPLSRALVPTSNSLDSAFSRLRPEAPQLNHLTNDVAICRTTVGTFFNNTLQVFKYADDNGAFPRAQITEDSDVLQFGQPGAGGLTLTPLKECTDSIRSGS